MEDTVVIEAAAPAKVNLCLDVSSQVVEGRHRVRTVMVALSLEDRLVATFGPEGGGKGISIEMNVLHGMPAPGIAPEDNLIYKAIAGFCGLVGRAVDFAVHVKVDKRIPEQSGLAGGSSDCAAAIMIAAKALGFDPRGEEALATARSLGSDIAFFLTGGCAALGGYGDELVEEFPAPYLDLVIARPERGCPTGSVYREFDGRVAGGSAMPSVPYDGMVSLLRKGARVSEVASSIGNSLQEASFAVEPQVREVHEALASQDRTMATLVSGSGSCCFSICRDSAAANLVARAMRAQGFWAQSCSTSRHGARLLG